MFVCVCVQIRQALGEADQACGELQKTASHLEGKLAELDHWNTEAMELCQHLKESQHRGHQGPHPTVKVSMQSISIQCQ